MLIHNSAKSVPLHKVERDATPPAGTKPGEISLCPFGDSPVYNGLIDTVGAPCYTVATMYKQPSTGIVLARHESAEGAIQLQQRLWPGGGALDVWSAQRELDFQQCMRARSIALR